MQGKDCAIYSNLSTNQIYHSRQKFEYPNYVLGWIVWGHCSSVVWATCGMSQNFQQTSFQSRSNQKTATMCTLYRLWTGSLRNYASLWKILHTANIYIRNLNRASSADSYIGDGSCPHRFSVHFRCKFTICTEFGALHRISVQLKALGSRIKISRWEALLVIHIY